MNIQVILKNPELINNLSAEEKTKFYINLNNLKTDISNKLAECKARKELLEKQKADLLIELFKEAEVNSMEELTIYVKKLQEEFDEELKNQAIKLNGIMEKLNI